MIWFGISGCFCNFLFDESYQVIDKVRIYCDESFDQIHIMIDETLGLGDERNPVALGPMIAINFKRVIRPERQAPANMI